MIINGIICSLLKNCHGRLEVTITDTNTDEYIGFDQHEPLAYALYKTLEKYFKNRKESYGDEDNEKSIYNMDCQNNMPISLAPIYKPIKIERYTNKKSKTKKSTASNGS